MHKPQYEGAPGNCIKCPAGEVGPQVPLIDTILGIILAAILPFREKMGLKASKDRKEKKE